MSRIISKSHIESDVTDIIQLALELNGDTLTAKEKAERIMKSDFQTPVVVSASLILGVPYQSMLRFNAAFRNTIMAAAIEDAERLITQNLATSKMQ